MLIWCVSGILSDLYFFLKSMAVNKVPFLSLGGKISIQSVAKSTIFSADEGRENS